MAVPRLIIRAPTGAPNAGSVLLDTSDSPTMTRRLGTVSTTTAAGSVNDARIKAATAWWFVRSANFDSHGKTFSVVDGTLSWTSGNFASDVEYGV